MNDILKDYGVGVLLMITSAAGSGIIGYFKGKKSSTDAISRKNSIYQPLVDELSEIATYTRDKLKKLKTPFIVEVIENNYKYSLDETLRDDLNNLMKIIFDYNNINLISIADGILIEAFINGFEILYGSTIDGVSEQEDLFGNKWEETHEVIELEIFKQSDFSEQIKSLLLNEGYVSYTIRITENNFDYTYDELVNIFSHGFNFRINGEQIPKRVMQIDWEGTPEEYIAYHCNFFRSYDNNVKVKEREKLRENIIINAQRISENVKEIIENIVKKYEKEIL